MSVRWIRGAVLCIAAAGCGGPPPLAAIEIPAGECSVLADLALWDAADESVRIRAALAVDSAAAFSFLEIREFSANDRAAPDGPGQRHRIAIFEHTPTGMHFVLLPGGAYTRGVAPPSADDRWLAASYNEWDGPPHQVTLTQPFLFCRTEVPLHVWDAVPGFGGAERVSLDSRYDPALKITCDAADDWCRAASLELPSEAEWEYAARGTSTGNFFYSYDDGNQSYRYIPKPNETRPSYLGDTNRLLRTAPNAFGIFGASDGKSFAVPEWTCDTAAPYPTEAVVDPRSLDGSDRVFRDPRWVGGDGEPFPVWKRGSRSWEWHLKNYVGVRPIRRLFIQPR